MPGGQRSSTVTIRRDLVDLVEEIQFEDLRLTAERIAPTVGVSKDAGKYPVLSRETRMKLMETRRHRDGSYPRSQWEWEDDSYITYEYGFEEPVDNVDQLLDEEYIDLEAESSQLAWQGLLLGRESRVATALLNTSTWTGANNTTAITNEWDDAANATPWTDIDAAAKKIRGKSAMSKEMLSVIISDDLIDYAVRTTEVKDQFKYTNTYDRFVMGSVQAKADMLARYFSVKEVIPTSALYDVTNLASAANIGKFWSNEFVFLGKLCPPGSTLRTQGVIKQLAWSRYSSNFIMEDYEEPSHNRKVIRAREYRGIKIDTDYGHLLTNAKTTVNSATGI